MEDQNIPNPAGAIELGPADIDHLTAVMTALLEKELTEEAVVRFSRLRSPDQAEVMTRLDRDFQAILLDRLTHRHLGEIIEELEPEEVVELTRDLEPHELSQALDEASPETAADVLRSLPENVASEALSHMDEADTVVPLLGYDDDDAGGLMTPEFIVLGEGMNVGQAMEFIGSMAGKLNPQDASHFFVVDDDRALKGSVALSQLVLGRPYQRLSLLMDPQVISVSAHTDQERCAQLMKRYNLFHLPVVDENEVMVGVLNLDDMVDVFEDEATEDMYRLMGVDEDEKAFGPFLRSVRNRLPWLYVYLGSAFLAALVIGLFESTISRFVVLAVFINLVAGQGGQGGAQTVTLVVRSMALGEIAGGKGLRLIARETALGVVHGVLLGIVVGLVAYLWKGEPVIGLVLAIAMVGNMIVASLTGAGVPLLLRRFNMDPAVSSAVFVTTFTDVMGVFFFLGLATLLLKVFQVG